MTTKTAYYAAMADEAARQVTGSRESWTSFLRTAGRLYKYPYHEQLMIHAQRPDATACAEYDLWNNTMRRYVKRGSKGIALLDNSGDQPRIRYVFDVSDTGTRQSSRPVKLWQMQDEYVPGVQAALEKAFGVSAKDTSLESQIEDVARAIAGEYWEEHGKQIIDIIDESYLVGYDEYNIGASFRNAATISIAYTLLSRCTDNPDSYFDHEDFLDIFDFNTRQTANALGTAVSELSSQMFREIEVTIRNYERNKQAERSQNHDERVDLQPQRRLSDPGHSADPHRDEASGQVREDAPSLSGAEQSHPSERLDPDRAAVPASHGDRRDGAPESGAADGRAAGAESRPGQGHQTDGVGAAHEQPESAGRGAGNDRTYQQLTLTGLFPSEAEQISFIEEAESRKPSAFSFAQNEIDQMLQLGINSEDGRMVVALEYLKGKSMTEIVPTLQEVYHGGYGLKTDNRNISAWFAEDGIRLAEGNGAEYHSRAQTIPWEAAAKRIGELMEEGQYCTNVELAEAPGYERQKLAQSIWYLYHDLSEEAREKNLLPILGGIRGGGFPDETERLAKNFRDPGFVAQLRNEYQQFQDAHAENRSLLRFHYHKLDKIAQRLAELDTPLREYPSDMAQLPLVRQFITDDEISHALCGGSGFSGGKRRIYEFWQENHTKQEKADFLKNEHGTGGRSHALSGANGSGEDHDAKGIRYTKAGCDKVQLSWPQVVTRMDALMAADRYLTADEKSELEDIQEAQQLADDTAEEPVSEQAVGRIDFLGYGGMVGESVEYTDAQKFIQDIQKETASGAPMTVVLYQDDEGKTIPKDFIYDLDPPPKGFYVEDAPRLAKEKPETFVDQVMSDAERIAAEQEPPYERFSVIPVEDGGFVVWDDLNDGVYTNENGIGEQYVTEEEAQAALETAKEKADAQTAADWLYVEQAKVKIPQSKEISDTDVRSLFAKTTYLKAELGEIATFFTENPEPEVRADYLQKNFNYEFTEVLLDDKRRFGYKTHNDHLEVWEGNYLTADAKRDLLWSEVAAQFAVLVQPELNQDVFHDEMGKVWNYQIGDTVYLEGDPYQITDITDHHVELLPPGQIYPIYRSENRENFERLLAQDHRNLNDPGAAEVVPVEYQTQVQEVISGEENHLPYDVVIQTISFPEPKHFIDHFYVVEDLKVQGPLVLSEYSTFPDALRAYQELPSDKVKALGAAKVPNPLPGSLDLMQCIDGQDKVVQDYTQVAGWENPEIHGIVAELHSAIETKVIPEVPAVNYQITDDHLGEGGAKAKFRANMDAIKLLRSLQEDDRNATPEEQEILSQYVGWGGLADAFDQNKPAWASEYQELSAALSPEEYAAARASTLNAHYTSPTVIRSMYEALEQMGFESGNVLEPAMGIGNFFGMMPDSMRNSRLYGVELDPISGQIAQKLYPNAEIKVAGFETTDRRDFYDVAIGNVPFGNYKVADKPYDKLGLSIHNYFFVKSMDQVRPGGVVAFVTSRFTLDSKNSDTRRLLAQKADFLGAIRLPNDAFKKNAGTDVVSDIIFLQKRDRPLDIVPEWVNLTTTPDGFTMNTYFADHPEMVLGELTMESTQYGKDDLTVRPYEGKDLSELLHEAVSHIQGSYQAVELSEEAVSEHSDTIPADPEVKNFSYTVVDGEVYFRENSVMRHVDLNEKAKERVCGMVELRGIVNDLIRLQLEDYPDEQVREKQAELNAAYDAFTKDNGLLNSRANGLAFDDDSSYYLLCSLENVDEDGNLISKADMFTKRTIKPEHNIDSVDTPSEALAVSIGERGKVDMPFMAELLGTPGEYDAIIEQLTGVIFKDPMGPSEVSAGWKTADDYLSGDVRSKLQIARMAAQNDPTLAVNVDALEKAQPKDLDASEIDVRLGATWIDPDYIQQFMEETFETPYYLRRSIEVKFAEMTAEWRINGKSSPSYNDVAAYTTYGTERANAYRILEETLNLKDIRIYDTFEDADGKQKRVLNKKETTLAQQKQQAIKDAFRDWIWKDPRRRETLVQKYNVLFNSTRPREYDGSHITFGGMNPEIKLREHQKNAIAHVLYGGNTLLAHEVGAGKTFEMAASAMESKRLGLSQKALFVVPNHLTLQWANEFLHLYPSAKLLVATRKDFETANRKKFCARIATGDYDAVILGHSQFEKIPLSAERQQHQLEEQIEEIEAAIAELKWQRGENFSIKQMEKTRKSLQTRLDKLTASDRKDDVITFEQLGVDRLFVDESQAYKNCAKRCA